MKGFSCLIGFSLLLSSFYMSYMKKDNEIFIKFYSLLNSEQKEIYENIVRERLVIYFAGSALGIISAYLFYRNNKTEKYNSNKILFNIFRELKEYVIDFYRFHINNYVLDKINENSDLILVKKIDDYLNFNLNAVYNNIRVIDKKVLYNDIFIEAKYEFNNYLMDFKNNQDIIDKINYDFKKIKYILDEISNKKKDLILISSMV